MTDLSKLTKEELLQLVAAGQDGRPYHVHQGEHNGVVCRSPYCNSLFDPPHREAPANA